MLRRTARVRSMREPDSRARGVLLLAAIACAIGGRGTLLAVQAGDIERVGLVLGSEVVFRSLPFDEPFYLTGKAGSLIDSVSVWISTPRRQALDCKDPPSNADRGHWARRTAADDSFFVRMTELDPNRGFDLCVSTRSRLSEDRLARLRTAWRTVIDSAFRRLPDRSEPTAGEVKAFQKALIERIGEKVVVGRGSLLDTLARDGSSGGLPKMVDISSAQWERLLAIEDVELAATTADTSLRALKRHRALPKLVAIRTATHSGLKLFAAVHRQGLRTAAALQRTADAQLGQVAEGEIPLVRPSAAPLPQRGPLREIWTVDELEPRGRSILQSVESTTALLGALRALEVNPSMLAAAGISRAEAQELGGEAQAALDALASVQNHLLSVAAQLGMRTRALDETTSRLTQHEESHLAVEAHTHFDVRTSAKYHIAADFGALYLPDFEEVTPVLGANFYFRPVNPDRAPTWKNPWTRLSVSLGITTSSLAKAGERDDLFGSFNLAFGAGARLTRIVRLSGGFVFLKQLDPDPLVDQSDIRITPYAGITLDLVVKDVLSSIFGTIF